MLHGNITPSTCYFYTKLPKTFRISVKNIGATYFGFCNIDFADFRTYSNQKVNNWIYSSVNSGLGISNFKIMQRNPIKMMFRALSMCL